MGPVLVLGDRKKEGVAAAVEEFRDRLESDFGIAAIDLEGTLDVHSVQAEWALVFGGDGAILSAARRMADHPIPTLSVNFGRFGFLTEIEHKQLPKALDRIKAGKTRIARRLRLIAQCGDWREFALNDVVISAAENGRMFDVGVSIAGHDALRYSGDGVVVATPTGSTAYSLAAGGPILEPGVEAIVITPLCAHALTQRPLVIPSDEAIELTVGSRNSDGLAVIDGQVRKALVTGDRLKVKSAGSPFLLLRVGIRSYYVRLRKMLGWSETPKYARESGKSPSSIQGS